MDGKVTVAWWEVLAACCLVYTCVMYGTTWNYVLQSDMWEINLIGRVSVFTEIWLFNDLCNYLI